MKVFILAAMTADGFVARGTSHLSSTWTTQDDKRLFTWLTRSAKVMVVGNSTYKTFEKPFPGRRIIVMTRNPQAQTDPGPAQDAQFTDETPAQILDRLEKEEVKAVAICGGPQIYDQFMETGRVDEFYLTIQPAFFGTGMKLFTRDYQTRLTLEEAQVSAKDNSVILHYTVSDS